MANGSLIDQYRQMMMWRNLGNFGRGLAAASAGGQSVPLSLMMGVSQLQRSDPREMMQLEQYQQQQEEDRRRQTARSKLFGGYDPKTEITWNQGIQGPSGSIMPSDPNDPVPTNVNLPGMRGQVDARRMGLLAQANPELMEKMAAEKMLGPEAKAYTDIGKLNADLKAGLITEEQFRGAASRLDKPEKAGSLTGRMRWIMATGKDPDTGREFSEEERGMFAKAMAPGSAETREGFLRDWLLANARNFRTGPDVMEEGNKLYDMIQGIEPEVRPEQPMGTVEAAQPPGPPVPGRKPADLPPYGRGVTIPLPPMELDEALRARADSNTFTEEELGELQVNDPDQFELLYRYLKGE